MRPLDEHVLKVSKEIVAKFIEVGRVSPASFDDTFKSVFRSVKEAIVDNSVDEDEENSEPV
ncbi:MAG: hypothetical protein JRE24_12025 [Deltaproteobacteria bacterium]|nr:hypothetical protein [Deltaproteobacteria bacterium]MBW2567571.1 hypothetical protein [Deltaproteobacteria bacterium]